MLYSSLKTSVEFGMNPAAFPKSFYFDNYKALYLRFDVFRLFSNTFICIAMAWLLSLVLAIPASYAFAKLKFGARNLLFMAMIATMAIPGITFIIPNYL